MSNGHTAGNTKVPVISFTSPKIYPAPGRRSSLPMRWWSKPQLRPVVLLKCIPVIGLVGCGSCGIDEDARARCAVDLGGEILDLILGSTPSLASLSQIGPHPVWSTQPHPSCNYNPTFRSATGDDTLEFLLTYAATDPLESGFGDVAKGTWPVILFAHANNYNDCRLLDGYANYTSSGPVGAMSSPAWMPNDFARNSKENLVGRGNDLVAAWSHLKNMTMDVESPLLGGWILTESCSLDTVEAPQAPCWPPTGYRKSMP